MDGADALAALEAARGKWLPGAALALAAAGVPVFPCAPGGKHPITRRGFLDATTDRRQVRAWWRRSPWANIGIPTGAASGLVVVDVDVHGPVNGTEAFARADAAGLVAGWGLLVSTPTGGQHAYFPAMLGGEQRSWQSAGAGIDFRGDGGYIVAPPSLRMIDGFPTRYRVVAEGIGRVSPVDSGRLRDFLNPRPTPTRCPEFARGTEGADVDRLASWVAGQGESERNRSLFWAACRLAENGVPILDARDVLVAAARQPNFEEREITRTVNSAYRRVHAATIARDDGDSFAGIGAGGRQRAPARGLA